MSLWCRLVSYRINVFFPILIIAVCRKMCVEAREMIWTEDFVAMEKVFSTVQTAKRRAAATDVVISPSILGYQLEPLLKERSFKLTGLCQKSADGSSRQRLTI